MQRRVDRSARNAGLPRARSIIVRSTSSTAYGPSVTMCCAHVHRPIERREIDDAQHAVRAAAARASASTRASHASVPSRADQQVREIDAAVGGVRPLALRPEDVEVVAAARAASPSASALDLRRARARRWRRVSRTRSRDRRPRAPSIRASGPKRDFGAVGEHRVDRRARCAPCCRRRSSASRRSCCRPCRRAWPAPTC